MVVLGFDPGYVNGCKLAVVDKNGKYLRKECSVSCSRSYYVGEDIEKENVKAKYDNGMLTLTVPKSQPKQLPSHNIEIE